MKESSMFGLPQGMEIVVLLVVVLLLFGGSRLAGMGKGAGRAIREFKEEVKSDDKSAGTPPAITPLSDRVTETQRVVDSPSPEQRAKDV